jgi:Ca2+-binding EF-hand superfamily protein
LHRILINTPSKGIQESAVRRSGTQSTPKTRVAVPVSMSNSALAINQPKKVLDMSKPASAPILDPSYIEVYRRLVSVPVNKFEGFEVMSDLGISNFSDGFVLGEGLRHWFDFFDKNHDGSISFDEFTQTLRDVNIEFDLDDAKNLFSLFQTVNKDDVADFDEFMEFFSGHISHKIDGVQKREYYYQRDVIDLVEQLSAKIEVECKNATLCEAFFKKSGAVYPAKSEVPTSLNQAISLGLYSLFVTLSRTEESSNQAKFRKLGIKVGDIAIARLSRVFKENSVIMAQFFKSRRDSFRDVLKNLRYCILESFSRRVGDGKIIEDCTTETVHNLWNSVAKGTKGVASFEDLTEFLKKAALDLLKVQCNSLIVCNLSDRFFIG